MLLSPTLTNVPDLIYIVLSALRRDQLQDLRREQDTTH